MVAAPSDVKMIRVSRANYRGLRAPIKVPEVHRDIDSDECNETSSDDMDHVNALVS